MTGMFLLFHLQPVCAVSILFNSVLEIAILSDFKMENVIIWHLAVIPKESAQ